MNKKKEILRLILHVLVTALIMAFIFRQSAFPAEESSLRSGWIETIVAKIIPADPGLIRFWVRKTAHFTEYLALGVSLMFTAADLAAMAAAGRKRTVPPDGRAGASAPAMRTYAIPAWIFGALYAVSDEVHQKFVPGRSCELRDMMIDAAGVAAGVLLTIAAKKIMQRKRSS